MFYVGHKGFQITFPNNYIFSVQFGNGNYCENYNKKDGMPSFNAEIAYKKDDKESIWEGVEGWLSPLQVLERMNEVAALLSQEELTKKKLLL